MKRIVRYWVLCLSLVLVVVLSACSEGIIGTPAAGRQAFPVDMVFKEFYETLGGRSVLGPVISPLETRENLRCQYTERALMCFNQQTTDVHRFSLYPLGVSLGVQENAPLSGVSAAGNGLVIDGFVVYEKFIPLYDQLYGQRYTGRPITEPRINHRLNRIEQYFENVGFYQNLNDMNGPVALIPYGAYLCGDGCSYFLDDYWFTIESVSVEQPFAESIARLGGPSTFGNLLLKAEITPDGYIQQVYENVIFYAPVNDLSQVGLRQLPLMLGNQMYPLVEKKVHDQMVFYEIADGLGHNVPLVFDVFIAEHGGRSLSGKPLHEVRQVTGQHLYQQCFENYCLLYDPNASELMKVRLEPLGKEYIDTFPPPEDIKIGKLFSQERIELFVSEDKPNLNASEEQVIRMLVQQRETGQPIDRVEATVDIQVPGRERARYHFPPSDGNGASSVVIPPMEGLSNGLRILYQVCLKLPSETPICQQESYMIWDIE